MLVKLNREMKLDYFNNLETLKNSQPFGDKCGLYFSNKHTNSDSKIILIEKDEITTNTNQIVEIEALLGNNGEIGKSFNKHFAETVEKLNSFEWPSNNEDLTKETLTKIIEKLKNHSCIVKSKSKSLMQVKVQPVLVKYVEKIIKNIPNKKASGDDTPIEILKYSGFTYQILTDCTDDAINKGIFPDSLKITNITPLHKKEKSTDEENYRPVGVLPLL